jgi:hypothetical protein
MHFAGARQAFAAPSPDRYLFSIRNEKNPSSVNEDKNGLDGSETQADSRNENQYENSYSIDSKIINTIRIDFFCLQSNFHISRDDFHISRYNFHISRYNFHISRYNFHISRYSFHISRYSFHISRYDFYISRYSFHISRYDFYISRYGSYFSLFSSFFLLFRPSPHSQGLFDSFASILMR